MKNNLKSIKEIVEEFDERLLINGNYYLPEVEDGGYHWNIRQQQVIKDVKEFCKTTLTQDRHAIGERILEWVESHIIVDPTPPSHKTKDGTMAIHDYNQALRNVETFIKSELMN